MHAIRQKKLKYLFIFFTGFFFTYCSNKDEHLVPQVITPETALNAYINNGDTTYHWTVISTYNLAGITAYDLLLTSQKWREFKWVHQLTILVPANIQYDGALLWITGGSIKNGEPKWASQSDGETWAFGMIALKNNAIVAIIRQTPNQPLFNNLTEDALISYTLHQYKSDGDYSWPLLFPMTKTAIRAMDAVQQFSKKELQKEINRFVISGASKRGWTTWLTGSQDKRVEAIAPAVIDVLNMPVNLDYQLDTWGAYSPEIQDYVDLGIPQDVHTEQGKAITTMIDPYSYRQSLTMPKLILLGTNDPYWPVDAIKNYYDDIPGQNFIHYVPNAGHGLDGGEQALRALNAFFGYTLAHQAYPALSWKVSESAQGVALEVQGSAGELRESLLWTATSEDRDFRDEIWSSTELAFDENGLVNTFVDFPGSGYKAFYIDLEYPDMNGDHYTKSTRMFVSDDDELFLQ
jgi:PhoPQ-activated pathogenicity-related protein